VHELKLDGYRAQASFNEGRSTVYQPPRANASAKADVSIWVDDKRQWLSLAQSWLGLIRTRERAGVEALAKGTGQEKTAFPT
jgi:hypothetical protein